MIDPSYISGYVDGEGSFLVSFSPRIKLTSAWAKVLLFKAGMKPTPEGWYSIWPEAVDFSSRMTSQLVSKQDRAFQLVKGKIEVKYFIL